MVVDAQVSRRIGAWGYRHAVALSRYAEPISAERILREFAALCAHEPYTIPLKNPTDTQWLFGLHPVQIRRMPLEDDETPANATGMVAAERPDRHEANMLDAAVIAKLEAMRRDDTLITRA